MKPHILIVWGVFLSTLLFSVVWAFTFSGFVYPDSGLVSKKMNVTLKLGDAWVNPYIGHLGEDFIGDPGESIYSIADGVVEIVKDWPNCPKSLNHGWGNVLIIKHEIDEGSVFETEGTYITDTTDVSPKKVYSQYGHVQNALVQEGDYVKKGQKIAEIGHVCNYSLDHLHFELKDVQGFEDDLFNGAGRGYSGTENYAPHRYSPSKFIELNKNLTSEETEQENPVEPSPEEEKSWWEKTKDFIGDLFGDEDGDAKKDVDGEKIEDEEIDVDLLAYDLDIINENETFDAVAGQEIEIKIKVKNTGDTNWVRGNVSLNIAEPVEQNKKFKHNSWLTSLRPTLLDQSSVGNGQEGTFSFFVTAPDGVGEYSFQSLVVKTGEWFQIGDEIFTANINVLDDEIVEEEIVEETLESPEDEESLLDKMKEGIKGVKEKAEDIIDDVVDTVIDIIKDIPTHFGGGGGGGGGGGNPDPVEEPDLEEDVEGPLWFSVTYPSSTPWYTQNTTTTMYGEKSEYVEAVFINESPDGFTYPSSTAWQISVFLEEGEQDFNLSIKNNEDNVVSSTTISFVLDTIAPTEPIVEVSLSESITSTLDISWESSDEGAGIDYYDVEYKKGIDSEWLSILESTTSTNYMFEVDGHGDHYVRVRAIDKALNISLWSSGDTKITTDWSKEIVINEVAWMGISQDEWCDYDEWVELYNPGDEDVSLDGWAFEVAYDDYGYTTVLNGTIEAGGYYIIGKYEDVIRSRNSDSVFVEGTDFEDSGARLVLWNSEIEKIDETDQRSGWFAGTMEEKYRTMERVDPKASGGDIESWKTNESIRYGVQSYCGQVYGSPGQDNNNYWYLDNIVDNYIFNSSSTLVLSSEHSPYLFGRDVTIPEDYIVQIDSGVTLLGVDRNSSFVVEGSMYAQGNEDGRIVFTSINDTNNNIEAEPGDWQNIIIKSNGIFDGEFVDFFYGGNPYRYDYCTACKSKQVIRNEGGQVKLENASFDNIFVDEEYRDGDAYVWSPGGEVILHDSSFASGYRGLLTGSETAVDASGLNFSNFSFGAYPVEFGNRMPTVWKDNVFVSNTYNMAKISVTEINEDYTIENGSNFFFVYLDVSPSSTLTLNPGAILNFHSYGMFNIFGSLITQGTVDNPVYITSPNRFGGIYFNNSTSNLLYTYISNGGGFANRNAYPIHSMHGAVVWSRNSKVVFDSCSIMENRRPGNTVHAEGSNTIFKDSVIGWEHSYDKAYVTWRDNGIFAKNSVLHLDNVVFKRINYAVEMYGERTFSYENMSRANFENMFNMTYGNWFPQDLFSF